MPTFEQPVVNNQIIIDVALSLGTEAARYSFRALLDTGAQITAISPNVVQSLGLTPIGTIGLTVASGQTVPTFEYRAWVDIPVQYDQVAPTDRASSFFSGKELSVAGLGYNPDGYDVLLGMDLLGMFHLTIYGNRIILSN